ncbi:hypothetical protein ACFSS8_16770 [Paracoccus kondratievae]
MQIQQPLLAMRHNPAMVMPASPSLAAICATFASASRHASALVSRISGYIALAI